MNGAYIHLLLDHVPVIGILFVFLLFIYALVRKDDQFIEGSPVLFVLVAFSVIPVYLSGEPAEEIVEHLPGVTESSIENHEEAAWRSLIVIEALGLFMFWGLLIFRPALVYPGWFITLAFVSVFIAGGLLTWTANLGGRIRHSEVRPASLSSRSNEDKDGILRKPEKTGPGKRRK